MGKKGAQEKKVTCSHHPHQSHHRFCLEFSHGESRHRSESLTEPWLLLSHGGTNCPFQGSPRHPQGLKSRLFLGPTTGSNPFCSIFWKRLSQAHFRGFRGV